MKMKIGITYNLKDELSPDAIINTESCEEFDTPHTINTICELFEKNGYETARLGCGIEIIDKIKKEKVDFIFNIAEGLKGRSRESQVPSILEMLNMPYSGSDPLTLGLTLDKSMAKKIALQASIPTPRFKTINTPEDLDTATDTLKFPLIAKPAWEGSSKGVYNLSKVSDRDGLHNIARLLFERYPDQPILVEEYIEGREITVGVIGNNSPKILGLMEITNKICPGADVFYSLETKRDWERLVDYVSPPDITPLMDKRIRHYAFSAFREFGARDIARMDFRISKHDEIFFLEINPLPGLSPEYADLVIMSQKNGISYEKLVLSIFYEAISRYKNLNSIDIESKPRHEKI